MTICIHIKGKQLDVSIDFYTLKYVELISAGKLLCLERCWLSLDCWIPVHYHESLYSGLEFVLSLEMSSEPFIYSVWMFLYTPVAFHHVVLTWYNIWSSNIKTILFFFFAVMGIILSSWGQSAVFSHIYSWFVTSKRGRVIF